ncbi:MAG: phenylacetate--CoA ligase family protein, partial [Acidobacteria bacterium]|nr:phenylacetate--CoA ligase family protein [Acidobacteriota bacterium]
MTITDDQLERLKKLIDEILTGNQFYKRKLIEAGITDSSCLRSIADLELLPLTTREELTEDQASYPPFGTNLTYPPDRYVHWHRTSGAHGRPLHWLDTHESWDWLKACWVTVFDAAEVDSRDRIFFAFSFGPFLGFWIAWAAAEGIGALRFSGANQSSLERLRNIVNFQITVVCSTPTYALHLAEIAEKEGIDLRNSSVNKLIVAGEPGGSIRETRELIEKSWGTIVFDHAGATEVGPHSFACSQARSLHLNEGEYIAEVFNEFGVKSKTGELVLTNLGRWGSPVIRYRTGDLVRVDDHSCPCGRPFISFNGGIAGRLDEMIIIRGVNVFPGAIESVLRRFEEVQEFQIEVSRIQSLDEMVVTVEVSSDLIVSAIRNELADTFGLRIPVIAVKPNTLPRFEMKARRFIDKR